MVRQHTVFILYNNYCLQYISTGVIIGVILHYTFPQHEAPSYYLVSDNSCNASGDAVEKLVEVGDTIELKNVYDTSHRLRCSITGRVFTSEDGEALEQSVSAESGGRGYILH